MNHSAKLFPYKKVMVIDDSNIDRRIAKLNIERFEFAEETISKGSARSALQYLEASANLSGKLPGLILLDIRMPEIDGFKFLDEYGKLPESIRDHCTIMMLTSSLNPDDMERAKKSTFVKGFVNKPINSEKLKELKKIKGQSMVSCRALS